MTADLLIYATALFFLVMGLVGIFQPMRILEMFSAPEISAEMRNEARAIYGGFGVAIAAALVLATQREGIRGGVLLTVALALFGMAAGRIVSLTFERPSGKNPYVFLILELVLGSMLSYAYWTT